MSLNPKTQKRVESILKKIQDYMDIRFTHAVRVNPKIGHVYDDVRWQQLTTLRQILESSKAFGPDRYYVADMLCDDNMLRKRALFTATDQNSIFNEVINIKDRMEWEKRAGQLPIHDMRTFYSALDPSLEKIVELIQTWIWWDIADSSGMVAFEHQAIIMKQLQTVPIEGQILEHYQKTLKKAASELDRKMILQYEFDRLENIYKEYQERRTEEAGFQMILKRDVKEDKTLGEPYDYKENQLKKLSTIVEQFRTVLKQISG
jgi:hypothetical protein